uniref:BHLH domain-containing protein n=1 Tax=Steinernema glaseri TaxID=37863 RepID=A0A1I8A6J6_9BILA
MTASSKVPKAFCEEEPITVARDSEVARIEALNRLRHRVGGDKLSSPIEIIQSAIDYIRFLQEQLETGVGN